MTCGSACIPGSPGNSVRDDIPGLSGPARAKGEPGERGNDYADLVKSNWKQCVWKRNNDKDSDLIQVQEIKDHNYLSNSTNTRQRTLPGFQSPTAFWLR